jgi:hypothetical protein
MKVTLGSALVLLSSRMGVSELGYYIGTLRGCGLACATPKVIALRRTYNP